MAGSLLIPMSVSARYVHEQTAISELREGYDGAFDLDGSLAAGVHLHWALPDALTSAQVSEVDGGTAFFPGVPDRWLVVRFDPADRSGDPRGWSAWVLDSAHQTVKSLDEIAKLTSGTLTTHAGKIHTAIGMLPAAAALGRPGWGMRHSDDPKRFDPLTIAYYPACAKRFGFHDPLNDVDPQGMVAYTVVGWYSDLADDPLHGAVDRKALLDGWKLSYMPFAWDDAYEDRPTPTWQAGAGDAVDLGWKPNVMVRGESQHDSVRIASTKRSLQHAATYDGVLAKFDLMNGSFPIGREGDVSASVVPLCKPTGPYEIRCHGSVFEVKLGLEAAPASIGPDDVRVYPSVQRAMAEIACSDGAR